MAEVDRDRMLQVLSNLIGNALKFTPDGGSITLSAKKQESHIEVSVTDNGPGIAEQDTRQIFERFSQLKRKDRRGLGLGLYIAKWIVEAHHGRIWVTSEVGRAAHLPSLFQFPYRLTLLCFKASSVARISSPISLSGWLLSAVDSSYSSPLFLSLLLPSSPPPKYLC